MLPSAGIERKGRAPDVLYAPSGRTLAGLFRGYTVNGARQLRLEAEAGVIAPGKQADPVVLERDLFGEPPHRIHDVRVDMTMLAGDIVFARKSAGL